jgi:hypothetical protein
LLNVIRKTTGVARRPKDRDRKYRSDTLIGNDGERISPGATWDLEAADFFGTIGGGWTHSGAVAWTVANEVETDVPALGGQPDRRAWKC